jgi:GDPmannose 4,6-dehydratase
LDWKEYVEIDPRYFRPAEVDYLLADASKARKVLGWEPEMTFTKLVHLMVAADMKELEALRTGGNEAMRVAAMEGGHA